MQRSIVDVMYYVISVSTETNQMHCQQSYTVCSMSKKKKEGKWGLSSVPVEASSESTKLDKMYCIHRTNNTDISTVKTRLISVIPDDFYRLLII